MEKMIYRVADEKETLKSIAEKFNVTPLNIKSANNMDDDEVYEGMRLVIQSRMGNFYVVKPFEDLATVARKTGTTVAQLKRINNLDTEKVFIGQKIYFSE